MFTGQGSQMVGMAHELYETNPTFQNYLEACITAFDRHLPRSLREVIFEDTTHAIHQTRYTQPALFAIEIALAQTLLEWGMKPDSLIGHSIGEIVAACVSGMFSIDDAVLLVVERARLMDELPSGGGMLAVFASEEIVLASLKPFQYRLQIAGLNHDNETVVSGDLNSLNEYAVLLKEQGISTQTLIVSHGFHSHLMEPMLESFNKVLEGITFHPPRIPIASNVTGEIDKVHQMMRPDYWVSHVRNAVRFADGMKALSAEGVRLFIEIGARPILSNMGNRILGDKAEFLPLLHPRQSNWQTIYHVLDRYYRSGFLLDWSRVDSPYMPSKLTLPTYVFDRKRHWLKTTTAQSSNKTKILQGENQTAKQMKLGNGVMIYEASLHSDEWLVSLDQKSVLLGESILVWVSSLSNGIGYTLQNVEIIQPTIILDDKTFFNHLQAVFTPLPAEHQFSVEVFIQSADEAWELVLRSIASNHEIRDDQVLDDFLEWDVIPPHSSPFVFSASPIVNVYQHDNHRIIRFDDPISLPFAMIYGLQSYGYGMGAVNIAEFRHYQNTTVQSIYLKTINNQIDLSFWDSENQLVSCMNHVVTVDVLHALRKHSDWQNIQNWFYDFSWVSTNFTADATKRLGHWLVFADPEYNVELSSALEKVATRVTYVVPDTQYTYIDNRIGVRLNIQEDLERALAHSSGKAVLQGVLFAWNLAERPLSSLDSDTLLNYEERIPTTLLQLASAISKSGLSTRLWGVTVGSQAVDDVAITENGLLDSMLWGLGRVITLEMPEIWGGIVDLDPHFPQFEWLIHDIATRHHEDQIAYRNGTRYVARLIPQTTSIAFQSLTLKRHASYLITGGLGKLGLLVAMWMAERGAGRVILTSRAGLPPREEWETVMDESLRAKIKAIEGIESLGMSIDVVAVDVTDHENMAILIRQYASDELYPLSGVVHAAGVLASEYVTQIEQDSLIRVLTPKVQGSWLLHQLTQHLPLDFFVQYSSAAATWGSAMAAHYVAANQFQDTLAHYRRSLGMKTLSINWGWWAEGGMVSTEEQSYFDAIGLQVMPSKPAIMALEHWLASDVTQKTVAPVDWSRYKPVFEAKRQRPFLQLIQDTHIDSETSTVDNVLLTGLHEATQTERFAILVTYLQKVIGDLLRLDPTHPIDPQTGFFDVGMDSLTSVELKLRLEQSLGVELPSTIAFEYPTVHDMVSYLLEDALHLGDKLSDVPTEVVIETVIPNSQAISDDDLEDLSDDDLLALLQDELK